MFFGAQWVEFKGGFVPPFFSHDDPIGPCFVDG